MLFASLFLVLSCHLAERQVFCVCFLNVFALKENLEMHPLPQTQRSTQADTRITDKTGIPFQANSNRFRVSTIIVLLSPSILEAGR